MRLSQRMCWALGAICLGAGLVLPWAAVRVNEAEVMPVVKTVRLRPALVRLPGGSFLMGSPEEALRWEEGRHPFFDELPQRLVEVSAFSLCQTEVSQGQVEAAMGENPSDCTHGCGDDLPVQNVRWLDAVAYLNRLTELESEALVLLGEAPLTACYGVNGQDVTWNEYCTGYRLPTEAEWEYAVRAGTTTSWSFGEDRAVAGEYAWYDGNAEGKVHAVGTKKANPWGLHDLHGNVWERVWGSWDWWSQRSNTSSRMGSGGLLRGGSFNESPKDLRSARRHIVMPEFQFWGVGFRCARGPGPQR